MDRSDKKYAWSWDHDKDKYAEISLIIEQENVKFRHFLPKIE